MYIYLPNNRNLQASLPKESLMCLFICLCLNKCHSMLLIGSKTLVTHSRKLINANTFSLVSMSYECRWRFCYQQFESAKNLYYHVHQTHTRQQQCSWENCTYTCKRRAQLLSHFIVHIPYFPFQCSFCNKLFKRKHDFNQHNEKHLKKVSTAKCLNREPVNVENKKSLNFILN